MRSSAPSRTPWSDAFAVTELALGGLLTAGGALLALMRATDGGPHGGAFLALGVVAVLPVGAALLIAGLAAVRRWRGRRWLHVLPPLALAGTVLYLRWLLP